MTYRTKNLSRAYVSGEFYVAPCGIKFKIIKFVSAERNECGVYYTYLCEDGGNHGFFEPNAKQVAYVSDGFYVSPCGIKFKIINLISAVQKERGMHYTYLCVGGGKHELFEPNTCEVD
jgi:hypothetical protein